MTLKEELEILRGEPIKVWEGDPRDIPCIETSDPEFLCKHPVVSVHMITYNHEPYIREAIEGVMMQKTDFEFELVIGEDCSTDKTREICFEYQKKYPDKVRVLWWHKNSYQFPHPAGGNGRRNLTHCRGEFIAICEGDDYWIDPLKLQKQVEVMRKYPNVGLCFCGAKIYREGMNSIEIWNDGFRGFTPGVIPRRRYMLWMMFGKEPLVGLRDESWQMTATLMARKSVYEESCNKYDIFSWKLNIGDAQFCLGVASLGDVYYLADNVSVYRQMQTGVTFRNGDACGVDTMLVRYYFYVKCFGGTFDDIPDEATEWLVPYSLRRHGYQTDWQKLKKYLLNLNRSKNCVALFHRKRWSWLNLCCCFHLPYKWFLKWDWFYNRFFMNRFLTTRLSDIYESIGGYNKKYGCRESIIECCFRKLKRDVFYVR